MRIRDEQPMDRRIGDTFAALGIVRVLHKFRCGLAISFAMVCQFGLVVPPDCACWCVDTLPQTYCPTVQAAKRDQRRFCDAATRCIPHPTSHFGSESNRLSVPEGALQAPALEDTGCYDVRVWQFNTQEYATVKICGRPLA